ncbi:DUF2442 domain-containing protein [Aureimonas glaciei]|uniref:DUF2442 domain-containing protein n=1 Tax=Aureimonas glaciei TaxID=1776957 RepID=A0A917D9I2_9HYPH|nr:DUF2442 domain-containing protein [Aureimonas glaciei]GGD14006.1 hypothetical protein GCM10011335_15960 [Aureimonas glaciei]
MVPEISESELAAARDLGKAMENSPLHAIAARYDAPSGRLVIDFQNGATFMVPARLLQDLENAGDDDLAEVELEFGYALRWDKLDVDFTVPGIVTGIFGTASHMARRAGQAKSPAKAAAARENGRKGGRPKKLSGG